MTKTDRVNIYDNESALRMQIKLESNDEQNKLVIESKAQIDTHIEMGDNKKCYFDVQNINVAKPVSHAGLVVSNQVGKTYIDNYEKDPDERLNVLDVIKQAHDDIDNSNFDNVVKNVTHNGDLDMNDIQPFNDVGFYGAENEGTTDHKGFDTWQIPLSESITIDALSRPEINNTILALNSPTDIDGTNLTVEQKERAKQMKPFVSFDETSSFSVSNAYITVSFDESTNLSSTDQDVLNAIFATSLIKLSAMQNATFSATHHKKGMGLPAPKTIGDDTLYISDLVGAVNLDDNSAIYIKLWYNFISQHLVTLNAHALSENYTITDGLLPVLTPEQIGTTSIKIKAWDIILIDNGDNKATTLFNDLEYSQNVNNWQINNYIRGDTTTSFTLHTSTIHTSNNSRTNATLDVGGEVLTYPTKSFIWSDTDTYVFVDEFGNVSESISLSSVDNIDLTQFINLRRYIVVWNGSMPSAQHLKSEDGGAVFKIRVNSEYNGNMEVELIAQVSPSNTTYDGTTAPKKFSNIRNRKFPRANYDHIDTVNKVPMIRMQVEGFPGSSGTSDNSLYWLSMSRNHTFGKIIHDASKEILADSKYIFDAVSNLVTYSNNNASSTSDPNPYPQDRELKVSAVGSNINTELDKFASGNDNKSNAVWFYERSQSQTVINITSNLEADSTGFGFICIGTNLPDSSATPPVDYNIPIINTSNLDYRYVIVTAYTFNEITDSWHVILDEDTEGSFSVGVTSLLTIVQQYPYRFTKSSTSHLFKIDYPTYQNDNGDNVTIPSIWLIPAKYSNVTNSDVGQQNITVSYQNASVLSISGIDGMNDINGTTPVLNIADFIFSQPSGGQSDVRTARSVKFLSGINKFKTYPPTTSLDYHNNDENAKIYDNQTPLTASQINYMSVSSGSGGTSYYAMFLNQTIDDVQSNHKLYVSYEISPTNLQLQGTEAQKLNIYKNLPSASNYADPSTCVYAINSITSDGSTSAINADGTLNFNGGDLVLNCSQYNIDDKTLKTAQSVVLKSNRLQVTATAEVTSTLDLGTELDGLNELFDAYIDPIRNITNVKQVTGTESSNYSAELFETGSEDTSYSQLLTVYEKLELHQEDSSTEFMFQLTHDLWNIDSYISTLINEPNKNDFPRASNNLRLKNFIHSVASQNKTFDSLFNVTYDQRFNRVYSGHLFNQEFDIFSGVLNDYLSNIKLKTDELKDILVKGTDLDGDNTPWGVNDNLGYLWLQEKFADFMTLMEEATKDQTSAWLELSNGAENSGKNMSLENVIENFKTQINSIISDFMAEYNKFIEYLYSEYKKYLKLLEQHHDNIFFHDTLAKGIENIALDNGIDTDVIAFTPNQNIASGTSKFYKSGSTNAWILDSKTVNVDSIDVQLGDHFTYEDNTVTSLSFNQMKDKTVSQWYNKYILLEPTTSSISDLISDLASTSGDSPTYNMSAKGASTENGLLTATDVTPTSGEEVIENFVYLQITFTNVDDSITDIKNYILRSVTLSYTNNLYKVVLPSGTMVSVNHYEDVTIDGNQYKVIGGTARSTSFVVSSTSDISNADGIDITLSTHNNTHKVHQQSLQNTVSCTIEPYYTTLQMPTDNVTAFNNLSSQYIESCADTSNTTILERKWDNTNLVFDVSSRYPTIVQDPSADIHTELLQAPTSVNIDASIIPVQNPSGFDTSKTGVVDVNTNPIDHTTVDTLTYSYDNSINDKSHYLVPEANAFNTLFTADTVPSTTSAVVYVHIVVSANSNPPNAINMGIINSPVSVNKHENYSIFSLSLENTTVNDVLTNGLSVSKINENDSLGAYSVIVEVVENDITYLYTLLTSSSNETPQGTITELFIDPEVSSFNVNLSGAFVLPRLSATINTQSPDTENATFAHMLALDPTSGNEADIVRLLSGFLKNVTQDIALDGQDDIQTNTQDLLTGSTSDGITFIIGLNNDDGLGGEGEGLP